MMKKIWIILIISFFTVTSTLSQFKSDSLVRFSDLTYHSEFEKQSVSDFLNNEKDPFNLYLSINEEITFKEAIDFRNKYFKIYNDLKERNVESKKINKKIKITYSTVHSRFPKKYLSTEYFPAIFNGGTYNCVSATMLYSLVFDSISIPYKVMVSSDHVYLVANPGPKSIVIETTNPSFENAIFTGEFKQQYVNYLRNSNLISIDEYKNQSVEEIFEAKFKEVKEAKAYNLPGIQYFNKALYLLQNNQITEGYELCQKAYFFYPDQKVKTLLYTALLLLIEKCQFSRVADIDYVVQLSRFENTDYNMVQAVFHNIISHYLQYTDKEPYCDSLFKRLTSQLTDPILNEELSFSYYILMAYRYQSTEKAEYYADKALQIKGNHNDANMILANCIQRKVMNLSDPQVLLDTISQLETKYDYELVRPLIKEYKLVAYLQLAREHFKNYRFKSGEEYLNLFENSCDEPIDSSILLNQVEITYATAASYYLNNNYRTQAKKAIQRGLLIVPNSTILNSVNY